MTPRRTRAGWPPNLKAKKVGTRVYYSWRDPRDGSEHSLQAPNNFPLAATRAKALNGVAYAELEDGRAQRVARGRKGAAPTLEAFEATYFEEFSDRSPAANTMRSRRSHYRAWARILGDTRLDQITPAQVAETLKARTRANQARTAQALRAALVDVFVVAQSLGLVPAGQLNPAAQTRTPRATVQRARLTLEALREILQAASSRRFDPWLGNVILLALVTAQRREDLAQAQFRQGQDWPAMWQHWQEYGAGRRRSPPDRHPYPFADGEALYFIQAKTGARVRIPLDLRLEALEISVGEVVSRCRDRVASRYLIHHSRARTHSKPGDPVHLDTLSRRFAAAREVTGLAWPGQTPPTFHELRSLAERLYSAQGINTQALLGHRHARTTAIYADYRGADWVTIGEK